MPPREIENHYGSLDAMRFRRHSAKLLWAMARDEREEVWPLAGKVSAEFLAQTKQLESVRAAMRRKGAGDELGELEGMYRDASRRAIELEEQVSAAEKERARLVAEAGEREARLREEIRRRKALADEISRLEHVGTPQVAPPTKPSGAGSGMERRARKLEKKIAALEKQRDELAARADRVAELEEENARLREKIQRLRDLRARERAQSAMEPETSAPGVPLAPPPKRARGTAGEPRVGVFLDVANLSGAARRLYGGAVDYRRLLAEVVGKRRLNAAQAFAIDKGAPGYERFTSALRHAGFKVFTRKPKTFEDGTVKADWDVGIAVEMMALRDKLDVAVLGSGDGDFLPVVSALQAAGVKVELATFPERAATELCRAADAVIELDRAALEH
jgi:uncharacterized LabA/DUF88 family protein/uncharacterized coiled-coil protein SlyX